VLKNALDWASRPVADSPLSGKPVALIGAGGAMGTSRAQLHLRQVAVATSMLPLSKPELAGRSRSSTPTATWLTSPPGNDCGRCLRRWPRGRGAFAATASRAGTETGGSTIGRAGPGVGLLRCPLVTQVDVGDRWGLALLGREVGEAGTKETFEADHKGRHGGTQDEANEHVSGPVDADVDSR